MTETSRQKMDNELERLYDELRKHSPESDEYMKISRQIEEFTKLANEDDKRETENSIASFNRGSDSEKLNFEIEKFRIESERKAEEEKCKAKEVKKTFWISVAGLAITAFSWVGTWLFNDRAQDKAHDFESEGTYTSKSRQWMNKEPRR